MSSLFGNNTGAVPTQIVARAVVNGKNFYTLQAGSTTRYATELGLYDMVTLEGLIAAGYKIIGYNGNIQSPDGTSIKDIIETPCTAAQSVVAFTFELEDTALSEQEASSYFSRDVEIKEFEFKKSTDEIKTRGELEAYLAKWDQLRRYGLAQDYRPLNSFVAREALYDISELADSNVARYYEIISRRRRFKDYASFEQLITFLQGEGVLGKEYNIEDVVRAYMSWGVCGIKTPVVSLETKFGLTCGIFNKVQTSSGLGSIVTHTALMNEVGEVFYGKERFDLSIYEDESNFGQSKVRPNDINDNVPGQGYRSSAYFKNKESSWDKPYKSLAIREYVTYNRVFVKFLDSNGVSYEGRFDPTSFCIVAVSGFRLLAHGTFLAVMGVDGTATPLKRCTTREDYETWQVLKAKAYDLVKKRTKVPPVKSSFELCLKEGVSPEAAVSWAGSVLERDPNQSSKHIPYSRAGSLYTDGPEEKFIKLFNPNNYTYSNIDELTEIFKATRDEQSSETNSTYLVTTDKLESASSDLVVQSAIINRPVELLEFAKGFKEGDINIGYFAEGLKEDGTADYDALTEFLLAYVSVMGITDISTIQDAMLSIESNNLFDVDEVFKYREAAYLGYLKDRAGLNGERAKECVNAVIVTKIFREGANVPIAEQRHYMFECILLDLTGKGFTPSGAWRNEMVHCQDVISKAIVHAVNRSKESEIVKECIKAEAPALALDVMFNLVLGVLKSRGNLMDNVILRPQFYNRELEIVVPTEIYEIAKNPENYQWNAQCTLYDWCSMERSSAQWNMYCLNAGITPWEVNPKGDFVTPTYNFKLNYILPETFNKLSESYRQQVASSVVPAKVLCIQRTYRNRTLVPTEDIGFIVFTDENINSVLEGDIVETPEEYYKRIVVAMKRKAEGKFLKRVPLKSDIIFKNWWSCFYEGTAPSDVEWDVDSTNIGLGFLTYQVEQLGNKATANRITASENTFCRWSIIDQDYEDVVKWSDLIRGNFRPQGITVITGNRIDIQTVDGGMTLDAKKLTVEEAINLVERGLAYQLAAREFLFTSKNQYYYLKVA